MNTDKKEQLLEIIDRAIGKKQIAGMNLLVKKEGQEDLYLQRGYANLENGKEIKRDTIFRLFSMTKPVTGAAAMILLERGLIDLAEPVAKYIPEFADQKVSVPGGLVPTGRPLIISDLLCMTGGLSYAGIGTASEIAVDRVYQQLHERMYSDNPMTTMEFAQQIASCPLEYQPGSSWKYCVAADVMAAVVEKVSGMRYGEFLKKELFDPLGMKDTGFFVPEEKKDRLAVTYEETPGEMQAFSQDCLGIRMDMAVSPACEAGGAGLVSTIDDYSKFASMLLNQGSYEGKRILLPGTVKFMTSHHLTADQQRGFEGRQWDMMGYTYGNLMRIMTEPEKAPFVAVKGEYGWDGWLGCYFTNIPSEKMTILMMMQKKDAGTFDLSRKLRNVILLDL